MKRYITMIMTAVLAFFMVSCEKESAVPQLSQEGGLKFDIQVEAPSMTKAHQSAWKTGDKIIAFFNNKIEDNQQMVMVYNGTGWDITLDPEYAKTLPASGKIMAACYPGLDFTMRYQDNGNGSFISCADNTGSTGMIKAPLLVADNGQSYTISKGVLKATLKFTYRNDYVQVTVKGITADDWKFYASSSIEGEPSGPFTGIGQVYFDQNVSHRIYSGTEIHQNQPIALLTNPDGASCHLMFWNFAYGDVDTFNFCLVHEGQTYRKTYTGHKIVSPCELVITGPDLANNQLNGWTL